MERLGLNQILHSSFSLRSVAESSEVISEVEEIQEVSNLQYIATHALKAADYVEALSAFNEALEIDENNAETLCGRAAVHLQMGKWLLAEEDAQKALAVNRKNYEAHNIQAQALSHLEYHRESLNAFIKALDLALDAGADAAFIQKVCSHVAAVAARYCPVPENLIRHISMLAPYRRLAEVGACLYRGRRSDICVKLLEVAQRLQTDEDLTVGMKVLLTMAGAHASLRHKSLAISIYQDCYSLAKSAEDVPYQTKSLVNLASLYLEAEETAQAILAYERLLSLQAELEETEDLHQYRSDTLRCGLHLNLSIAYKNMGSPQPALRHAEEYMRLTRDTTRLHDNADGMSHQNLGSLHETLGEYTTALEHMARYLEFSKKAGDTPNIAQAYGRLGTLYGLLNNGPLAKSYHEQFVSMANNTLEDDPGMLVAAHEAFGDTLMVLGDLEGAGQRYLDMFKSCSHGEGKSRPKALYLLAKVYRAQGKRQYSIYYFEQAKLLADSRGLSDVSSKCELHLASLMQHSAQISDLEQSQKYFIRLILTYEDLLQRNREEDVFTPWEVREELRECYRGIQNVLVRVGSVEECLSYAEESKRSLLRHCHSLGGASDSAPCMELSAAESLLAVVDRQPAPVLYYTALETGYLLWILQPGRGILRFHAGSCDHKNTGRDLREELAELVGAIKSGRDSRAMQYQCDDRALPYRDARITQARRLNQSLSQSKVETALSPPTGDPEAKSEADESSPQRKLFSLLLLPVYDVLSQLAQNSPLVIVPSESLFQCPFGALQDLNGLLMGDRFRISYVSSLWELDRVVRNETKYLCSVDHVLHERDQSRLGGVRRAVRGPPGVPVPPGQDATGGPSPGEENAPLDPTTPGSARDVVDLKRTSNPRLATTLHATTDARKALRHVAPRSTKGAAGHTKVSGSASLERMLALGSLSTLTTNTATDTDVTASDTVVTEFRQVSHTERCVVIGSPALPKKLMLHGREWAPVDGSDVTQAECLRVADSMEVSAIVGEDATKSRFLRELGAATVIHIATPGCLREGYLAFTPDGDLDPGGGTHPPAEATYLVTLEDIARTPVTASLVVLSSGWCPRERDGPPGHHSHHTLPSAFLNAGAQCVVTLLWPLPNAALDKFYHHMYSALAAGSHVTTAIGNAGQQLQGDSRFGHVAYWSSFVVVGMDVPLDLTQIRHAMLDQDLGRLEAAVEEDIGRPLLNPRPETHNVPDRGESLRVVQQCAASLLSQQPGQDHVTESLINLLESSLKRLEVVSRNRHTSVLPPVVASCDPAMRMLKVLGYDFQPKGSYVTDPYVVYPHWNRDDLLQPALESLLAVSDISQSPSCGAALREILPAADNVVSNLVDLLCITKNAEDIQLKVTDLSVKPLWTDAKVKAMLTSFGFHQVGALLTFTSVPSNRNLLASLLRFTIAVSLHKSKLMLDRLEVALLGNHQTQKPASPGPRLPSLNPVLLPGNQMRMRTPWLSTGEHPQEMDEKMDLARSKTRLSGELRNQVNRARTWHGVTTGAQADETIAMRGRPRQKPTKVKVVSGMSASQGRVSIDELLDLPRQPRAPCDQQRDGASALLQQRLRHVTTRHRQDVRTLYLPYITNC